MSWEIIAAVWKLKLSPAEKFVLMALADHVPNGGRRCFPGVPHLAWKTGFSERQVQRALSLLREKGIIAIVANEKGGRSRTAEYELRVEKGDVLSSFRPERVTADSIKGDKPAPERATYCHPNLKENLNTNLPQKGDVLSPFNGNGTDYSTRSTEDLEIIVRSLTRGEKRAPAGVLAELERRTNGQRP